MGCEILSPKLVTSVTIISREMYDALIDLSSCCGRSIPHSDWREYLVASPVAFGDASSSEKVVSSSPGNPIEPDPDYALHVREISFSNRYNFAQGKEPYLAEIEYIGRYLLRNHVFETQPTIAGRFLRGLSRAMYKYLYARSLNQARE